jgi:FKBP-type peptidyl-prolyl cis-trans isomerase
MAAVLFGGSGEGQRELVDETASVSYAAGLVYGRQLRQQGFEIDALMVAWGIRDGLGTTNHLLLDDKQAQQLLERYREKLTLAEEQRVRRLVEANEQKGDTFLEENRKREGIHVLASGVQFKVLGQGSGRTPSTNDTVWVHYRARMIDGEEFEDTYKGGIPRERQLTPSSGIPGLREALLMMPVGSKWEVFIPCRLGYRNGIPPKVPPGSTVIYDLELVSAKSTQILVDERRQELAERNKQIGAAFLAENAKKEGVVCLRSGAQYRVLKEGAGDNPKAADILSFHYKAQLIDGTEVANSYPNVEPIRHCLGRDPAIKGFEEILPLMRVGGKWEVFLPAGLAYGDAGRPPFIRPGTSLIFEIELLSSERPELKSESGSGGTQE